MNEREKLYLLVELLDGCADSARELLLRRYGGAEELIACAGNETALGGLSSARLEKLLDAALLRLEDHGVTLLTREDARYPHALFRLKEPPRSLYALGNLDLLRTDCLAVVGTRECSPEAYARVRELAREAARAGCTVVSGMALGCDAAAHRGALDAEGSTIAVLAGSVRDIYPRENAALYREILERGLILSETPEGARIYPASFLRRNRIVAGLSRAVLVTYARERSGTWSTARHAVKCGSRLLLLSGAAEALPEFAEGAGTVVDGPRALLEALGQHADAVAQTGMFDLQEQRFHVKHCGAEDALFQPGKGGSELVSPGETFALNTGKTQAAAAPSVSVHKTAQAGEPASQVVRHSSAMPAESEPGEIVGRKAQSEESREATGDGELLALLRRGEQTFAELLEATDLPAKQLQIRLLLLEMNGKVERLPGNRYLAK